MTIDEFQRHGPEGLWELVNGEPVELPLARFGQGQANLTLLFHLWDYVRSQRVGYVYPANTGFALSEIPPMVRTPRGAFVRAEQLPPDFDEACYLPVPPEIAIEGVFPELTPAATLARVDMWLEAGSALVWLVDANAETVTVYSRAATPRVLTSDDTLGGADILPDFTLPVRDIFTI